MSYTLTAASGRTATVRSDELARSERIAGLDPQGRIVVDDYDARNREPLVVGGFSLTPFMFALTLCCEATDKGCEDGVYCRACYGAKPDADRGDYLYRQSDGSFPGLDPVVRLERS